MMAEVTVVADRLPKFTGSAALIKVTITGKPDEYFVVSSVVAYSGFETLVFRSDAEGRVEDWLDVAGGRGMSRDAAIEELLLNLGAER